jgi:hypothetical protein
MAFDTRFRLLHGLWIEVVDHDGASGERCRADLTDFFQASGVATQHTSWICCTVIFIMLSFPALGLI